jgi:hypothetical protein
MLTIERRLVWTRQYHRPSSQPLSRRFRAGDRNIALITRRLLFLIGRNAQMSRRRHELISLRPEFWQDNAQRLHILRPRMVVGMGQAIMKNEIPVAHGAGSRRRPLPLRDTAITSRASHNPSGSARVRVVAGATLPTASSSPRARRKAQASSPPRHGCHVHSPRCERHQRGRALICLSDA